MLVELAQRFGRFGERLHQMARGEDARPVRSEWCANRSASSAPIRWICLTAACAAQLPSLLAALTAAGAVVGQRRPARGAWVKVRLCRFSSHHGGRHSCPAYEPALHALLVQALARGGQPVRLFGWACG